MNEILLKIPYGSKKQKKNNKKDIILPNDFLPMLKLKRRFKLSENSKITKLELFAKNSHRHLKSRDLSGREDEEHKAIFATIHDKLAKIGSGNYLSFCTNLKKDERIQ